MKDYSKNTLNHKTSRKKFCVVCGRHDNLTKHHVHKGKRKHRELNPYQKEWENFGKVMLCWDCHKSLHTMRLSKPSTLLSQSPIGESLISVKRESADSPNSPHDSSAIKEEANFS